MPKINDLNLKDCQEKIIKIYGDKYKIRKTFDIDDFLGLGIYGYDVCDEKRKHLFYYQTENKKDLLRYLKYKIYKEFI